ncbi:hypothetical protein [Rhodococcoides corynebacterioides]|uniref:hypothetical protein n=1 Tax=Rhodococcoides corynebacterioides TaxID=53972 RepID=UPI003AD82683
MSKRQRRAKAAKRTAAGRPKQRPALSWPAVLKRFAEWLLHSGCTADPLAAYSTAMAVDRSSADRRIVIAGADLPLELFDMDLYAEDCLHTPWSPDDTADALALFARFVVAERMSPEREVLLTELVDFDPMVPPRTAPVPPRCTAPLGPTTLTSYVRRVAAWCEDNGSVPDPRFAQPSASRQVRDAIYPAQDDENDVVSGLLSTLKYYVVVQTALGAGVLRREDRALRAGDAFDHWLAEPSEEWGRRSLVEAYVECMRPVVALDDAREKQEVAAACDALWMVLVRSLVGDAAYNGEAFATGDGTDGTNVRAWLSVRLSTMIDLGLIVPVNGQMCVPDSHAPALLDALDRVRLDTPASAGEAVALT